MAPVPNFPWVLLYLKDSKLGRGTPRTSYSQETQTVGAGPEMPGIRLRSTQRYSVRLAVEVTSTKALRQGKPWAKIFSHSLLNACAACCAQSHENKVELANID